jgi:hypothetical protein
MFSRSVFLNNRRLGLFSRSGFRSATISPSKSKRKNKSLTVIIETAKTERRNLQYQIRMRVMKLPREVAQERHRQEVLGSKRAWWAKHQKEKREIEDERKRKRKR